MLRRLLIRRAYNAGHWHTARHLALKTLDKKPNDLFARGIVIRSLWNEQDYLGVLQYKQIWEDEIAREYIRKAEDKTIPNSLTNGEIYVSHRYRDLHIQQPVPPQNIVWNTDVVEENFLQEGSRLWFRFEHGYTFWDMPKTFSLQDTHPNLLVLTAELILGKWGNGTKKKFETQRPFGTQTGLSFSAGTDSTAAALVMSKSTILGYHQRSFSSLLDHRNAERLINYIDENKLRKTVKVKSNHELIRTHYGHDAGFSTDLACLCHLVLLADHFDFGAIGMGMLLDNTWLWKGRKYREFDKTRYYNYWVERFRCAGLTLLFPIASISEAGALNIVKQTEWVNHLNSCMRGDGQNGCGECWKCFHKNGPIGRPFNIKSKEIQTYLNRRPMPTCTHALWALQKMNLREEVPDLGHLMQEDFTWWEGIYPPALQILPEPYREEIFGKISQYLDPMERPYKLEKINHFNED